jgi:hypothetical protein
VFAPSYNPVIDMGFKVAIAATTAIGGLAIINGVRNWKKAYSDSKMCTTVSRMVDNPEIIQKKLAKTRNKGEREILASLRQDVSERMVRAEMRYEAEIMALEAEPGDLTKAEALEMLDNIAKVVQQVMEDRELQGEIRKTVEEILAEKSAAGLAEAPVIESHGAANPGDTGEYSNIVHIPLPTNRHRDKAQGNKGRTVAMPKIVHDIEGMDIYFSLAEQKLVYVAAVDKTMDKVSSQRTKAQGGEGARGFEFPKAAHMVAKP